MGSADHEDDWRTSKDLRVQALVVGGGFGGIYTLYSLRKRGIEAKLFEAGQQLGGVWNYNRYPGARVDSEWPYYQLSIPEVWKTWSWSERFPGHKELRKYFDHCATVLGLYEHISFGDNVVGCDFDITKKEWVVETGTKKTVSCKYLVVAAGSSYKKHLPEFPGLKSYQGELLHAAAFPKDDPDFSGKRVAIIGQGATGIQLTQEISKQADHLGVYVRTPNTAMPMKQRKLSVDEQIQLQSVLPHLFNLARASRSGLPYFPLGKTTKDVTDTEREAICEELWQRGAFNFYSAGFRDYVVDQKANDLMYDFWRRKVSVRMKDARKRGIMAPTAKPHPFGTKRASLEQDYYECIDRPNVELVSLKEVEIDRFDRQGIITSDGVLRKYDTVVLATGYDAITGSFTSMGLRDTDGVDLRDKWKDGVRTHLGMTCPGCPNMFMVYSPQAPTALANGTTIIEAQADWVVSSIVKMQEESIDTIEALPEAAEKWAREIQAMNEKTLFPITDSWFMGSNIPGKKREQLMYLGGVDLYEKTCKEHQKEWKGFKTCPLSQPH